MQVLLPQIPDYSRVRSSASGRKQPQRILWSPITNIHALGRKSSQLQNCRLPYPVNDMYQVVSGNIGFSTKEWQARPSRCWTEFFRALQGRLWWFQYERIPPISQTGHLRVMLKMKLAPVLSLIQPVLYSENIHAISAELNKTTGEEYVQSLKVDLRGR